MKGVVKFYDFKKGFGFIVSDDNNEDIYFHRSKVPEGKKIYENDVVEFDIEERNGKKQATNLKF